MQFPHSVTPVRRLCLTRGRVSMERAAVSLLLGVMASTAAAAQDDEDGGSLPPSFEQMLQVAMSKVQTAAKAVTVTPAVVTIDPKTNTATFQLINGSTDSVCTTLKVQNDASQAAGDAAAGGASNAKGDAAKPSLASWIKDLPESVKLAPHEIHTVTVHVTAPAGLPSGTYTAYVVGTTEPVVNGETVIVNHSIFGPESRFITSKLVYQAP